MHQYGQDLDKYFSRAIPGQHLDLMVRSHGVASRQGGLAMETRIPTFARVVVIAPFGLMVVKNALLVALMVAQPF